MKKSISFIFSAGLAAFACGMVSAGENEPDYYVQWAGMTTWYQPGPYINTGYVFKKMPLVEMGVASLTAGDTDFLGTTVPENGCFIADLCSNGTGFGYYRYGSSSASNTQIAKSIPSLNTSTFNDVIWGHEVYYNGTLVIRTNNGKTDSAFANNTRTFKLFAARNLFTGTAKVSYVRMYNGTNRAELVRSYLPGVNKAGVIGFYDSVEDKFYTNAGTGSFSYGLRVAETNVVYIDTNWLKFGDGEGDFAYGPCRGGFAAGQQHTFEAPAGVWASGLFKAYCTGWKLYKFNSSTGKFETEPYLTGNGRICNYTHPSPAEYVRLEWQWTGDDSTVQTLSAGEWDDPAIWSSSTVPTKDSAVLLRHNVHCSSNVYAKSLLIQSGATLRFHASSGSSASQAVPDATGCSNFTFRVEEGVTVAGGSLILHGGVSSPVITNLNLHIGGDLVLSNAATMCVAAAAYNGACCDLTNLYNTATRLRIGGALMITNTAVLYTVCDQKVGSPVRIDCTNFVLGVSAKINADERGWNWYSTVADSRSKFSGAQSLHNDTCYTFAHGPGAKNSRGAGYGGRGTFCSATTEPTWGTSYGYLFAPYAPGSPSGGDSNYCLNGSYGSTSGGSRGGGVVWIVTTGEAVVNGKISATVPTVNWQAASGGAVWLAAKSFSFGEACWIDVSGGDAGSSTPTMAGGGGRISFAKDVPEDVLAAIARGEQPSGYLFKTVQTLTDRIDLSGGTSTATDDNRAESGTASYVTQAAAVHTVTIAGSPLEVQAVTPGYGPNSFAEGTVETLTAQQYGEDPANQTWRRKCLGYVVSNATEEIEAKSALRCDLAIGKVDLLFTWLWDEIEFLNYFTKQGPGHFEIDGHVLTHSSTNVYLRGSDSNVLTAVPDAGCEFVCWSGNVPNGDKWNPVITLTPTNQHRITGVFRSTVSGEPARRTWKKGRTGNFYDAANWDGEITPSLQDTLVVTSGVCNLPEYVKCAALEIGGVGKVVTARTTGSYGWKTNELIVVGNLTLRDSGTLQIGATDGSSTMYNFVTVGGNVTLTNSAVLHVAAGRRTGAYTWVTGSGFVTIGGDFRLEGSSSYCPNCDGYYGGSVKTSVGGRFFVAEGAKVNANGRGMGVYTAVGWNAGVGSFGTHGSAHYGQGGNYNNGNPIPTYWGTYDNAFTPMMPGQQNRETWAATLCRGGGVIRIWADTMRIDGTLTANGNACQNGNASGGTIWLVARRYALFGENAAFSVQGGYSETWPGMGAGGGGCVSICTWFKPEMLTWLRSHNTKPFGPYAAGQNPPERLHDWTAELTGAHSSFTNAPAPGAAVRAYKQCWGTFKALRGKRDGFTLLVR